MNNTSLRPSLNKADGFVKNRIIAPAKLMSAVIADGKKPPTHQPVKRSCPSSARGWLKRLFRALINARGLADTAICTRTTPHFLFASTGGGAHRCAGCSRAESGITAILSYCRALRNTLLGEKPPVSAARKYCPSAVPQVKARTCVCAGKMVSYNIYWIKFTPQNAPAVRRGRKGRDIA